MTSSEARNYEKGKNDEQKEEGKEQPYTTFENVLAKHQTLTTYALETYINRQR